MKKDSWNLYIIWGCKVSISFIPSNIFFPMVSITLVAIIHFKLQHLLFVLLQQVDPSFNSTAIFSLEGTDFTNIEGWVIL